MAAVLTLSVENIRILAGVASSYDPTITDLVTAVQPALEARIKASYLSATAPDARLVLGLEMQIAGMLKVVDTSAVAVSGPVTSEKTGRGSVTYADLTAGGGSSVANQSIGVQGEEMLKPFLSYPGAVLAIPEAYVQFRPDTFDSDGALLETGTVTEWDR